MTTRYWYQNALSGATPTIEVTAVRLSPEHRGSLPAFARVGEVASGGVMVDDPAGTLSFRGWRRFWVTEDELPASSSLTPPTRPDDPAQRIWTGYVTDIAVRRGEHFTGAGRVWDLTLHELNSIIHHRVIRSTDSGSRPAETDLARLSWFLSTSWVSSWIFTDLGLIDWTNPVSLDANDYTGHYFGAVLADLSNASGKNHFLVFHHTADHRDLFYARNDSSLYTSSLRISNVAADIDSTTVFAPDPDADLSIDPARVFAGIWLPYDGGAVYRTREATAGEVFRDGIAPSSEVKTAATATTLADRELEEIADPDEDITTELWLPAARIADVRPGHRLQAKYSHLPGYSDWRAMRVVDHDIAQDRPGQTDDFYRVKLKLTPAAQAGFIRIDTGTSVTTTVTVTLGETPSAGRLLVGFVAASHVSGSDPWVGFNWPAGWTEIGEAAHSTWVITDSNTLGLWSMAYKIADGTETSVSIPIDATGIDRLGAQIAQYTGASTFEKLGYREDGNQATHALSSISATPRLLIAGVQYRPNGTLTPATGYTVRSNLNWISNAALVFADRILDPAAQAYGGTFSATGTPLWTSAHAAFR